MSMSSTRRSSRRSSSNTQIPAWRSLSTSKNRAPASVSIVFAQPEHGKPLESAASKLPSAMLDDAASISSKKGGRTDSLEDVKLADTTPSDRMRTGADVQETAQGITADHLAVTEQSQAETSLIESPKAMASVSMEVPSSEAIPFPSANIDSPSKGQNSPGRSSWFSSLSRARGNDTSFSSARGKEPEEQLHVQAPEPSTPPAPSIRIQPSTPQSELPHDNANANVNSNSPETSQAAEAPSETHVAADEQQKAVSPSPTATAPQAIPGHGCKRSWFASPGSSPSRRTQLSSPLGRTSPHPPSTCRPRAQHSTSLASSIDEEVPRVAAASPPSEPRAQAVVQPTADTTAVPKVSSLNPATSRFTLTLPLLGRPKVPLEKAVAAAQAEDVRDPGPAKEPLETPIEDALKVAQEQDLGQGASVQDNGTAATAGVLREGDSAVVTTTTTTTTTTTVTEQQTGGDGTGSQTSATWWDYIGWGYSETTQPATSDSNSPGAESTHDVSVPEPTAQEPTSPSTATTASTATVESDEHLTVKKPQTAKASSIFSADTARSQGSSWYAPWSWYYSSANTLSHEQVSANQASEKTASERVKEEALARSELEAGNGDVTSQNVEQKPPSEVNPIESSINTNRSGWISFLASRALMMKTVTDSEKDIERDENGLEVMDIDDDTPKGDSANQVAVIPQQQAAPKPPPSSSIVPMTGKSGPEPKKPGPPTAPITESETIKRETTRVGREKDRKEKEHRKVSSSSPAPSKKSGATTPTSPRAQPPNLVLPAWADTFHAPPRSVVPPPPASTLRKTMRLVSAVGGALFAKEEPKGKGKGKARDDEEFLHYGKELPRAWDILGEKLELDVLKGCKKVVVIGIHGWFPGAVMRTVLGEPTGTSSKFVNMMCQALEDFQERHNVKLEKVTKVPLEGEGTIGKRVERLYSNLTTNKEWMDDIHAADVIFVATHSQGSIVSTHVLDRLIRDGHIRTRRSVDLANAGTAASPGSTVSAVGPPPQRVCCLAQCGIHLGPLRYLSTSSLGQTYIQYFESAAAKELFEFQNTESQVSKDYVKALRNVTNHGTKMVYVASMNDQVVPVYSGIFTSASHPLILRALYIDGDAYHSSDFMSNLLVLLIRVLNSGLSDSGLLVHLSEATAGSLSGVGHSTVYEELRTYSLAVDYLFLTNDGLDVHPELEIKSFNANNELNDYEIPWSLRDLIADDRVVYFFWREFSQLRDAFDEWHPKTAILRDIKRKLQPIKRLPSTSNRTSTSKL